MAMKEKGFATHDRLADVEIISLWRRERQAIRLGLAALTVLAAGFGVIAFAGVESELRHIVLTVGLLNASDNLSSAIQLHLAF
ncbi:MAG: hypothetical protein ACK5KM_02795 [Hyphomicrobiaceae bacterium]